MGLARLVAGSLVALTAVAEPASGRTLQQADDCESVLTVVENTPSLSTFVELARNVTLPAPPAGEQYTILAPSTAAFQALGADALAALLAPDNIAVLETILRDHILPGGAVLAADIIAAGEMEYQTLNSQFSVTAMAADGVVTVTAPNNGTVATVIEPDLTNCAGVIHVIDQVLIRGGDEDEMAELSPTDQVDTALAPGGAFAEVPAVAPVMALPEMAAVPVGGMPDFSDAMAPMGAYGGDLLDDMAPMGAYGGEAPDGFYGGDYGGEADAGFYGNYGGEAPGAYGDMADDMAPMPM